MINLLIFFSSALFWGGSFVAINKVVRSAPPFEAAFFRILFSLAVMGIFFPLLRKPYRVPRAVRPWIWITGLFAHGIPFLLLFWGEQRISAGMGGILNGTVPIWTTLFSLLFLKRYEKVTPSKITGILIGLVGLMTIFWPHLHFSGTRDELRGLFAVTGMAVCYSAGFVLNRIIFTEHPKVDLFANLFNQQLSAVFLLLGATLISQGRLEVHWLASTDTLLSVLYLGWISSALAFFLFYRLIREWGAVRSSGVTYLVPVFALLLDFLFNGTVPESSEIVGIGIILAGVALLQWPNRRKAK